MGIRHLRAFAILRSAVLQILRAFTAVVLLGAGSACNVVTVTPSSDVLGAGDGDGLLDVQILAPSNGAFITDANSTNFKVSGSCSNGSSIEVAIANRNSGSVVDREDTRCVNSGFNVTFASLRSLPLTSYRIIATATSDGGASDDDTITVTRSNSTVNLTSFTIEDGRGQVITSTRASAVRLKTTAVGASKIAIFNNQGCQGTALWQTYLSSISRAIYVLNGVNRYSVKVQGTDGVESACSDSPDRADDDRMVTHDNLAPEIAITGSPTKASYVPELQATDNIKNLGKIDLIGTCTEPGASVSFLLASTEIPNQSTTCVRATSCPATGSCNQGTFAYSLNLTAAYPDPLVTAGTTPVEASVQISAKIVDASSNVRFSAPVNLFIDTKRPEYETGENTAIVIVHNGNSLETNTNAVVVNTEATDAEEVLITSDRNCAVGAEYKWKDYDTANSQSITVVPKPADIDPQVTGEMRIAFAKFRDNSLNETPCIHDLIAFDESFPSITITNGQDAFLNASNIDEFEFEGTCSEVGRNVLVKIINAAGTEIHRITTTCTAHPTDATAAPVWTTTHPTLGRQVAVRLGQTANDGRYRLRAEHSKASGSTASAEKAVTLDRQVPVINSITVGTGIDIYSLRYSVNVANISTNKVHWIRIGNDCSDPNAYYRDFVEIKDTTPGDGVNDNPSRYFTFDSGSKTSVPLIFKVDRDGARTENKLDRTLDIMIAVEDQAGNVSACYPIPVSTLDRAIDTTPPVLTLATADFNLPFASQTITLSGTCEPGKPVTWDITSLVFPADGILGDFTPPTARVTCTAQGTFTFGAQTVAGLTPDPAAGDEPYVFAGSVQTHDGTDAAPGNPVSLPITITINPPAP